MNNLTYASGTQPFGTGSQKCLSISISDDELVEGTEKIVVCGFYEQTAKVIFQDGGCTDIFIEDNDGKVKPVA